MKRICKQKRVALKKFGSLSGVIFDAKASESFGSSMMDCSPCLTKSRGCMGHYWLDPEVDRFMNVYEVAGFQGFPRFVTTELLQDLTPDKLGQAFGDAMSLNVLLRILPRALIAAGLVKPEDCHEDCFAVFPKAGKLPDAYYQHVED